MTVATVETRSAKATARPDTPTVSLRGIHKHFTRRDGTRVPAIDGIDLHVSQGEFVVLLGPSGCGKTTLLRCVAGLESPDTGDIAIHGDIHFACSQGIDSSPDRRKLGMVFQSYALWPHMNVFSNVAYPLQVRHTARAAIRVAQAGSDAASAAFGPKLNMIGSICAIGCFGETPGASASVNFQLSIPIYAGGALGASIRRANIDQIKSEVDALSARDQIRESVISAWSSLQNSSAQIESAQSAVSSGQLVVEGTVQERDVGQKTTLDVLNAQAELTSAREGLIQARSSRMIAAFALLAASGRLSAEDLRLDVTIHSADGYIAKVEDVWQELRALDE